MQLKGEKDIVNNPGYRKHRPKSPGFLRIHKQPITGSGGYILTGEKMNLQPLIKGKAVKSKRNGWEER